MDRFRGQVAIITGGAGGIGKGIADRIACEGGTVALFDTNQALLEQTTAEFKKKGYEVAGYAVDISSEEEVREAFRQVEATYEKIDIMVNAAGIVGPTNTRITDYSTKAFDQIYAVNLRGTFLMTKYAVMVMEKHHYGRILLIASIGGKEGNPGMAGYAATKSGVMGLVKGVGKEYAQAGITVNGLAPAVIKTPMNEDTSPETLAYMTAKIPMGRLGTIEEVAALSTWIVSEECSFCTGFVFDISGGRATY
ncbi:MAG: SDR family NAD(P)-dependent oxidoreductase [Saprospiraceae bacterium]